MKFSLTLLACVSMAAAQGLTSLPGCARDCATGSLPTSCNTLDVKCICSNNSFIEGIACCVADKCSQEEQEAVILFANQICSGQGVTDLPKTAGCANGSQSKNDTSSGTSTASIESSSVMATSTSDTTVTETASSATHTPATKTTAGAGSSSNSGTTSIKAATSSATAAATSTGGAGVSHVDTGLVAAAGAAAAAFALFA